MAAATLRERAFVTRRWVQRAAAPALSARWYLRHAESVGPGAMVLGRPLITTPQITVGADFLLWSHVGRTNLGGTGRLTIGDRVFINTGAVVLAFEQITIEDDVALASGVFISDSDNHPLEGRPVRVAPIVIGRGAWIATRSMVLPGVHVGSRAVIAAGSVVVKDVPPDTLVAGVPARVIRTLDYPPGRRTAWRDEEPPA